MTDKQIAIYSDKLANDIDLSKYSNEKNYNDYAKRIAKELKSSVEKRAFYKPYLEKLGFKFNYVEAVEPVPTAPKQQKAIEAPAVPAPVDIDESERQKKADEFLSKIENILKNKSLKA